MDNVWIASGGVDFDARLSCARVQKKMGARIYVGETLTTDAHLTVAVAWNTPHLQPLPWLI